MKHYAVPQRLTKLKGHLSRWNYSKFGDINKKLKAFEVELKKLDMKGESAKLNDVDLARLEIV